MLKCLYTSTDKHINIEVECLKAKACTGQENTKYPKAFASSSTWVHRPVFNMETALGIS